MSAAITSCKYAVSTTTIAAGCSYDCAVALLGATRFELEGSAAEAGVPEGAGDAAGLAKFVREHPGTSPEVRALLGDLQVLGRSEFKQLLKWYAGPQTDRCWLSAWAAWH